MILGTSTISLNLGPIICHSWAHGPRLSGFSYTKIHQNIWEYLGNILFSLYENHVFDFSKGKPTICSGTHFLYIFSSIYLENSFRGDED